MKGDESNVRRVRSRRTIISRGVGLSQGKLPLPVIPNSRTVKGNTGGLSPHEFIHGVLPPIEIVGERVQVMKIGRKRTFGIVTV